MDKAINRGEIGRRPKNNTRTRPKGRKINANRALNIFNLGISILVFVTGLILLTQFHMGHGAHQKEWLGLGKAFWLTIHQISAIGFLCGGVVHLQRHWKYIKTVAKRWRLNLPGKIKSRTYYQILLLMATLVVLWAGFYPWITMPGATLEVAVFHQWIDVHARVGILFFVGMVVHIVRRWRRIIGT
jgi:hypothetical protein